MLKVSSLNLDSSCQLSVQLVLDCQFDNRAADNKAMASEHWQQACNKNSVITILSSFPLVPVIPGKRWLQILISTPIHIRDTQTFTTLNLRAQKTQDGSLPSKISYVETDRRNEPTAMKLLHRKTLYYYSQ